MSDSPAWVTQLADPGNNDPARVGGKAAHLCELINAGLPVPEGFVVDVDAFHAHFPHSSPAVAPEHVQIAPALSQQLQSAYERLVREPTEAIAVRSSALSEDGVEHSFAGAHATYYYITSDNLEDAVINCWLSLWSDPALAYRSQRSTDADAPFGMAVILQRMVQAESSGVCFTRDPTGQLADHALVEATWGLGAALVDGRVSPDRFFVATDGTVSSRRIGRKRFKVAENLDNGAGDRLDHVPAQQQVEPAITAEQLTAVVALARQAERHYDRPQDVEWALERNQLFLLQSRPITGASTPAATPDVEGRWVLFKPVVENFHEPLTPMAVDLFRRVLPPFGRFIAGRYYLNFDQMKRLVPLRLGDAELAELLLLRGTPPDARIAWHRLPGYLVGLVVAYLTTGVTWHRTTRLATTSLWRFAKLAEQVKNNPELDCLAALQRLVLGAHPLEPIGHRMFQTNASAGRYFILLDLLKRFLGRFAPDLDQAILDQICSGHEDMLSRQMVEGVRHLAELAKEDLQLEELLTNEPNSEIAQRLAELPDSHPFIIALEEFLASFGHRCVKELELMAPRWREDPMAVLAMAKNYLGFDAGTRLTESYGMRLAAMDRLHQALTSPWQRWFADYMIRRIRYYITLRENTRHFHSMAFDVLRAKLKQTEQELLEAGALKCADDIFFLTWNEASDLKQQEMSWHDAEPLIRARRRKYQERSRSLPPSTLNLPLPTSDDASSNSRLLGQCASPGYAEGTIKIVLDPTLGADLSPGDILVAPYTDPAWTPLFPSAAAIVVEVGSYLSHAGTVAREYQIPCLVDVANCTRNLQSGQRARVYATEGRLEVIP